MARGCSGGFRFKRSVLEDLAIARISYAELQVQTSASTRLVLIAVRLQLQDPAGRVGPIPTARVGVPTSHEELLRLCLPDAPPPPEQLVGATAEVRRQEAAHGGVCPHIRRDSVILASGCRQGRFWRLLQWARDCGGSFRHSTRHDHLSSKSRSPAHRTGAVPGAAGAATAAAA